MLRNGLARDDLRAHLARSNVEVEQNWVVGNEEIYPWECTKRAKLRRLLCLCPGGGTVSIITCARATFYPGLLFGSAGPYLVRDTTPRGRASAAPGYPMRRAPSINRASQNQTAIPYVGFVASISASFFSHIALVAVTTLYREDIRRYVILHCLFTHDEGDREKHARIHKR